MTRLFPVALLAACVAAACSRSDGLTEGLTAAGLTPLDLQLSRPAESTPPNLASPTAGADATRPDIAFLPAVLRVYRATPVELQATSPAAVTPENWLRAQCRWTFGDGSAPREGCAISHTFVRGTSDERISVDVQLDDHTWKTTRIIALERLPVSAGGAQATVGGDGIPAAPKAGPASFRMALVSATGFDDVDWARVMAGLRLVGPGLVAHLGQAVPASAEGLESWEQLREGLAEPLRREGIPVIWALSPADLQGEAMVRRPAAGLVGDDVEMAPGSRFPELYAFAFKGVFVAVATGSEQTRTDIDWLRDRLTEAQVYESRLVLSHLPLHPFSRRSTPVLGPKFKLYELFLRTRVSLVASAAHGVFYDGRYGALPVLSVGRVAGPAEALAGHDFSQPPTIAVVDIEDGQLVRTFALEYDSGAWRLFDVGYLPETVEVYTR